MRKLFGVIKVIFCAISIVIIILMMRALNEFLKYFPAGIVVPTFVLAAIAVIAAIISIPKSKGILFDLISIGSSLVAGILGFISYSKYKGWEDMKLLSIWSLIFIAAPLIDLLILFLRKNKEQK